MDNPDKSDGSLSFLDQCTVICLGYISSCGNSEIRLGKAQDEESLASLCTIADQELTEFGDEKELKPFLNAASNLVEKWIAYGQEEKTISEGIEFFQSTSLNQENFNEWADKLVDPPVESWESIAILLQLIYRTCDKQGSSQVGTVIDLGVRYMKNTVTNFVTSKGGWESLDITDQQKLEQGDISSSIVVVSHEGLAEELNTQSEDASGDGNTAGVEKSSEDVDESLNLQDTSALTSPKNRTPMPLSPLNTPPYSIPSSVTTDDDRDSLATPPELVERPLMTESFLRAMGEEEMRRISSASGNGFEMVGSENGGTDPRSPTRSIDDAQALESTSGNSDGYSEQQSLSPQPEEKISETEEKFELPTELKEESIFGGYLPHISFGVAAAAAVAGFFVIKKNM